MLHNINYVYSRFGIYGLMLGIKAKFTNSNVLIKVNRHDIRFPFYLRYGTSDIPIFDQVFLDRQYDFTSEKCPSVIVDAGANIGLASICFANRYPESQIIAIEPEKSNYDILKMNVDPYSNIIPLHAALWDKNERISIVDPGFGEWAFMTKKEDSQEKNPEKIDPKVQGMTVDKIMEDNGLEKIDILKIDIEGAEREVFRDSSSWIAKVDALIVELHERMKSGCNRSFYNGSNGFDREWIYKENVYLSRSQCLHPVPEK
jgi:FkbM family methyltransferase